MTDDEIIQSAEAVRIAEIQAQNDRERREHEKQMLRMRQREERRVRWHSTVDGILHPDSEPKGFLYFAMFMFTMFMFMFVVSVFVMVLPAL